MSVAGELARALRLRLHRYRSAITGRFVTRHPHTTVRERSQPRKERP